MNKNITTFVFDCFGVICTPVLNGWYKKNMTEKGLVDHNIEQTFRDFDMGKLSEDDIIKYFQKYDGINFTKEELRKDIDSFLDLDSKLSEIIKRLKNNGFKTILLSNANDAFFERKIYTKYPDFKNLFDDIVISSKVGMVKPNSDIFYFTLEKNILKPQECIFIDDSQKNVDGAEKIGINGYLYKNSDNFKRFLIENKYL